MLWFYFIFSSNFIFLCIKFIIIQYHTQKQKKINFEPRIKLNHNISTLLGLILLSLFGVIVVIRILQENPGKSALKGIEKQFKLARNLSYRAKFQYFDQGKGNVVQVISEFEL